jgi:hypothetical protein
MADTMLWVMNQASCKPYPTSAHALRRYGVAYVLDVCRVELGLAAAFFSQSHHPSAQLDLVEAVCNVLYDSMRPMYIQLQDPDDLVGLIEVLKQAVRSDALTHRNAQASAMAESAVSRITQDVQERLIFRSAVCLSDLATGCLVAKRRHVHCIAYVNHLCM